MVFGFGKKNKTTTAEQKTTVPANPSEEKQGYLARLKAGLAKTGAGFGNLFLGKKTLDDELLEDLETALLMADVGIEATQEIINDITVGISRQSLKDTDAVVKQLKTTMQRILAVSDAPLDFTKPDGKPFVLLMVGIAAAVEQLKTWGQRANVPVIAQGTGADSASVIYDAYESAKAKQIDVLIADTAGRLHTQSHLMSEIEKIVRVLKKHDPDTPNEIMLVIDAGNGQNALNQAKEFHKSLGLTGITITKLDGTAKGGIIFPLREFNATDFVEALLADLNS